MRSQWDNTARNRVRGDRVGGPSFTTEGFYPAPRSFALTGCPGPAILCPFIENLCRLPHAAGSLTDFVGEQNFFRTFRRTGQEGRPDLVGAEDAKLLEQGFGRGNFISDSKKVDEGQNLVGEEA